MSKESYNEQFERVVQTHMRIWEDMSDSFLEGQSKHRYRIHREAALRLLKIRGSEGKANATE